MRINKKTAAVIAAAPVLVVACIFFLRSPSEPEGGTPKDQPKVVSEGAEPAVHPHLRDLYRHLKDIDAESVQISEKSDTLIRDMEKYGDRCQEMEADFQNKIDAIVFGYEKLKALPPDAETITINSKSISRDEALASLNDLRKRTEGLISLIEDWKKTLEESSALIGRSCLNYANLRSYIDSNWDRLNQANTQLLNASDSDEVESILSTLKEEMRISSELAKAYISNTSDSLEEESHLIQVRRLLSDTRTETDPPETAEDPIEAIGRFLEKVRPLRSD